MGADFRVYVDEAGGRHVTKKSDKHFVLSAVVTADPWDAEVRARFRKLKVALGRRPQDPLHFTKLKRPQRLVAAEGVASLPIAAIISVIVVKDELKRYNAAGELERAFIAGADPLYLWAMRLLVERISALAALKGSRVISARFSHVRGLEPAKLYDYQRRLDTVPGVKIDWHRFNTKAFTVAGQRQYELLQVADTAASATYHAVEQPPSGQGRTDWLEPLCPKLYRGSGRAPLTSTGLKVYPPKEAKPGGSLYWLQGVCG